MLLCRQKGRELFKETDFLNLGKELNTMRGKGLLALETDLLVMSFVNVGNKRKRGLECGSGNDYPLKHLVGGSYREVQWTVRCT